MDRFLRRNVNITVLTVLLALSAFPVGGHASEQPPSGKQSYESCGLITSEYVTVLQLIARGLTPESLKESLPGIGEKAQARVDSLVAMASNDGLIDSYSTINSEYADCATKVFKASGVPSQGSREAHFHRCAGENKVGYEIAISALIGASKKDVTSQLAAEHRSLADSVFAEYETRGGLGMFDSLATELKRCLGAIP